MIRVCYLCHKYLGKKEPLDDPSVTHGLCDTCMVLELKRLDEEYFRIKGRHLTLAEENKILEVWPEKR